MKCLHVFLFFVGFAPTLTFDLSPHALEFAGVLDGVLSKLSRYDEGTFFSSILSFTVSARPLSLSPPSSCSPLHHLLVFLLLFSSSLDPLLLFLLPPPPPLSPSSGLRDVWDRVGGRASGVKGSGLMSSGHQV